MSPVLLGAAVLILAAIGFATWKAPRLVSVILWALVATISAGAAGLLFLPGPFSEKSLWLIILLPVIWAGLQWWTFWERRAWLVATGLMSLSAFCGLLVFLSEPVVG